ncbi:hypothetical protein AB0L71_11925 [Streptomyces sp. NPDC052052]|uniref:hypothetical protein n=1 Tax=Streptomyces sp. NPDC052052 TaxID=3154756 RepID=UPI003426BC46
MGGRPARRSSSPGLRRPRPSGKDASWPSRAHGSRGVGTRTWWAPAPPETQRQHLALACVEGLAADVAARGRTATWSRSRGNRASLLLAWTAGFRLVREYVHATTGSVTVSSTSNLSATP